MQVESASHATLLMYCQAAIVLCDMENSERLSERKQIHLNSLVSLQKRNHIYRKVNEREYYMVASLLLWMGLPLAKCTGLLCSSSLGQDSVLQWFSG